MTKITIKQKIYRMFMLLGGILIFLAGFYTIFKNDEITSDIVINNFIFFIAGAALIYSGLKWTGKKKS
ncbi:MAG: hypothetical protein GXO80_01020 [Chlorobi bacterium]|nr:hypothetical protein [Chlorobiota bacterium]